MKKYYRLSLNCGRTTKVYSYSIDYGFINILPQKTTIEKKCWYGTTKVPTIEYAGKYYVIAERCDDHFEDIILGKRIDFDPDGICDISNATIEELLAQLEPGLSCHRFIEIDPDIALYYMDMIKNDIGILNKYISELEELERKLNVMKEIELRLSPFNESKQDIKPKTRLRNTKSA